MATAILGMTEEQFWRCWPRKLFALAQVHIDLHSGGDRPQNRVEERLTLEDLRGWR